MAEVKCNYFLCKHYKEGKCTKEEVELSWQETNSGTSIECKSCDIVDFVRDIIERANK